MKNHFIVPEGVRTGQFKDFLITGDFPLNGDSNNFKVFKDLGYGKPPTLQVTHIPDKLHLGCYQKHIKGYINVDCREDINPPPDVVDDCAKLEKFENNSVSVIYNSHIIEHFKHREYKTVLKRWYDVLKPGGILRTATPDFRAICECYLYHGDLKPFLHSLYGSQRHDFDMHYVLFDEKMLTEALLEVGFKEVRKYDWRQTEHFYIDDYSQAYWPEISYNTRRPEGQIEGKLISLNLEAIK